MNGSKIMKIKDYIFIWFLSVYFYIKYGKLEHFIEDRIDYIICEASYRNELGHVIGYWGYGHFDQECPYRGQKLKDFCFVKGTYRYRKNGIYYN